MARYSQHLVYSMLAALAGLPLGCLAAGLLFGVYVHFWESGAWESASAALLFASATAFVAVFAGILPALLYGAPAYALASYAGRANALTAGLIGLTPGTVLLLLNQELAVLVLLFGTCVALATHAVAVRRLARLRSLGANNSSKPTPLRGAA